MAGRFAKSETIDEFWINLAAGRDCIGADARILDRASPTGIGHWVGLDDDGRDPWREFDAGLFGLSPREAERLEPQHRHFLELAWEALEDGGYSTDGMGPNVGVFGGANFTSYFNMDREHYLPDVLDEMIGADKDYLATRVAHHLGLQGPALTVQSACSTSLVAVHLACQALNLGECDAALAGGVSITRPRMTRYLYTPGSVLSPDGRCRAFDAEALGTVFTEGAAIVLLMRVDDALARGHPIYAVIRGSAVNNDGGGKASYMAPSIGGQERVIRAALAAAGRDAGQIGYVEAHGSATVIGDAIELAALTRVFRNATDQVGACRLGSVKTNIGHTASAAGVAGLMKAALALKKGVIPPNVGFVTPNPDLDVMTSPFTVNAEPVDWPQSDRPRFAAVSSFGVGGTNAHAILEEAPARSSGRAGRSNYVLTLSARTDTALSEVATQLRKRLAKASRRELADAAYTLNVGRRALDHRAAIVCRDVGEAREALAGRAQSTALGGRVSPGERTLAFMFPGQGSQYLGMGRQLYQAEPVFREAATQCLAALACESDVDLRPLFTCETEALGALFDAERIAQTVVAQPYIFTVEYALGRLLQAWGVTPRYAIGHSVGEFAAACLAGVFELRDALRLVTLRGRLMQALPHGAMLSVAAAPEALNIPNSLDVAAINGPRQTVVSGPVRSIAAFAQRLSEANVVATRLRTSHAFHSRMMEPMLASFRAALEGCRLHPPAFPLVSNVTGRVLLWEELCEPDYWLEHIRKPVRFAEGLQTLLLRGVDVVLEVGPGRQLSTLAQQNGLHRQHVRIVSTLQGQAALSDEIGLVTRAAARLWLEGVPVSWRATHGADRRQMVTLPAYPFEREEFRTDPPAVETTQRKGKLELKDWFYIPTWRRIALGAPESVGRRDCWIVLEGPAESSLAAELNESGARLVAVTAGERFARRGKRSFVVNPASEDDIIKLFEALRASGIAPRRIVHALGLAETDSTDFARSQTWGVCSLGRWLAAHRQVYGREPLAIDVVTCGTQDVTGRELLRPAAASVLSFANVAPQENSHVSCRVIDADAELLSEDERRRTLRRVAEVLSRETDQIIALRGDNWWAKGIEPSPVASGPVRLKQGGVYLITGGMGYVGLILARHLAEKWKARLVLAGRSALDGGASAAGRDREVDDQGTANGGGPLEGEPRQPSLEDRLTELRSLGGEALYVQADMSSEADVARLRAAALERFGRIDGIIFGAGTVRARAAAHEVGDGSVYDDNYAGKVHGLAQVLRAFDDDPLDFGVVLSSISTTLGGLGLCAYAAANHIADVMVLNHRRRGRGNWITTNWDLWGDGHFSEADRRFSLLQSMAIQPGEGAQALEHVLDGLLQPQVIVSTHDLQSRIDLWIKRTAMFGQDVQTQHKRPALSTDYAPPDSDLERQISQVLSRVLGIETIGRDDDFFEMGGHSILAVQAAVQIQERLPPTAPAVNLYDAPTIRMLAEALGRSETGEGA